MRESLCQAVRRLVEAAVANDRRNLQITELSDPELLRKLKNEQDYYAKSKARERFLDAAEFEPPSFQCFYEAENWTEDSLLSYILDPQGYAAKEATDYMEGNQEEMLFDFLCNDVELTEYQALVDDRDNPVHIVKKIMAAMNTTSAKTVNVTVCKDGEEFSFKAEAQELRRALFLVMDCLFEGKPYLVYMTAGANKFLRIYYGRVKEYLASLKNAD